MARPPLPLGEHGSISVTARRGLWVARCRFRSLDGVTRHIQKSGKSKTAARVALQEELRTQRGERTEMLRPESRFREAADIWMGKIRARRADSTADTYDHCLQKQVLPQLGELRLYECDVAQLDAFFTRLERARRPVELPYGTTTERPAYAANSRRQIRAIVSGVLQQRSSTRPSQRAPCARWSASSPRRATAPHPARPDPRGTPPPARLRRHEQGGHPC